MMNQGDKHNLAITWCVTCYRLPSVVQANVSASCFFPVLSAYSSRCEWWAANEVLLAVVSRGALLRAAGVCSSSRCVLCVGTTVFAWQEATAGGKHDLALCCPGAFSRQRAMSSQNLCDTIRTLCLSVCLSARWNSQMDPRSALL